MRIQYFEEGDGGDNGDDNGRVFPHAPSGNPVKTISHSDSLPAEQYSA